MSGLDPTTTVMVSCAVVWLLLLSFTCAVVYSCQGYHHTPTNIGHCCARFSVCTEKERLFILMAPGIVCVYVCMCVRVSVCVVFVCLCINNKMVDPRGFLCWSRNKYCCINQLSYCNF